MWRPILHDDSAIGARDAIAAIAAELADPARGNVSVSGPTMGGGDSGIALFYAYLGAKQFAPTLSVFLDHASAGVETRPLPVGLYGGFSGVAWVVQHVKDRFPQTEPLGEDPNEDIDQAIGTHLAGVQPPVDYDLIMGLVGLGLYFIERLPRETAARGLQEVIGHLAKAAERRADGITWWTPPSQFGWTSLPVPDGCYNLGVAHGVPGVIGLLGEACAADVAGRGEAMQLLEGAVQWVLAQRRKGRRSIFPYYAAPGLEPNLPDTRLAWCYGDLGIAVTLLGAARAVGRDDWEREAIDVARNAARRPFEASGVVDACICHGAVGIAHLFNRMYQATGDTLLHDAALCWYGHTLSMRKPGEWLGGFYAWESLRKGAPLQQVASRGFLTGAAGVGLCLLAAVEAVDPAWDRLILARIAPRRDP